MMKSILSFLLLAAFCLSGTSAFSVRPSVVPTVNGASSSTSLNVFGNRKTKDAQAVEEESKYWQGEWVCKDCGYIYNRVSWEESNLRRFKFLDDTMRLTLLHVFGTLKMFCLFDFLSKNVPVCTLKNKDLVSVAHNVLALVVVMPKRSETV